jgi:excinuclease ABC subunit A
MIRGRKGEHRKELADLQKRGYLRVKLDGKYVEIADAPVLDKKLKHDIDVVVDRLVVRAGIEQRLAESFEAALGISDGIAIAEWADLAPGEKTPRRQMFSSKFACPVSGFTIPEIEPRLFSFNSPHGACPACDGLGTEIYFDPDLVVPDDSLSMRQGVIAPWSKSSAPYYTQTLDSLARHFKVSVNTPFRDLPANVRKAILYGTGDEEVKFVYDDGMRRYETKKAFEGVMPNLERRYKETESAWIRE